MPAPVSVASKCNSIRTKRRPTPHNWQQFQAAQGQLSTALSRLLLVSERYPELKANQNFLSLQAQLEGTENRISVERGNFNKTVQDYNVAVRSFPTNLIAGMLGFPPKPFFAAQPGAEKPPPVQFNFSSPAPRARDHPVVVREWSRTNSAVRILGSARGSRAGFAKAASLSCNLFEEPSKRIHCFERAAKTPAREPRALPRTLRSVVVGTCYVLYLAEVIPPTPAGIQ